MFPAKKKLSTKYKRYIKSKAWREFKARIIAVRGRVCELCSRTTYEMHLHHLTYVNLGHELPSDVQLLCIDCHERVEMEKWARRRARTGMSGYGYNRGYGR